VHGKHGSFDPEEYAYFDSPLNADQKRLHFLKKFFTLNFFDKRMRQAMRCSGIPERHIIDAAQVCAGC
jgi:hypothetical protein